MTTHEKLCCLFAEVWSMFVQSSDFDSFDLQNLIAKHGFGTDHIVTEDEKDDFPDSCVGDDVMILSVEGKQVMEVAKQCSLTKK